jgi:FtsZ-interacting cell division protein ZipA
MANLRWILLLAGLVFLAALAAWEMRRPRQARRDTLNASGRNEPEVGQINELDSATSVPVLHAAYNNIRTPVSEPAQVELASYARYDEYASHDNIPPLEPPLVISLDGPALSDGSETLCEQPQPYSEPAMSALPQEMDGEMDKEVDKEVDKAIDKAIDKEMGEEMGEEAAQIMLPAAQPLTPIVEWPPEEQRHILSIRVVGLSPDRLSGRPLRQALSACGFVHGRFGIFHQPGADGRALISAANLSKPGVFDPTSMDFQRFRGLGLFAVLPGPLPPAAALDHLLDTAGDLAQRLQARLQDEHGEPLDEVRLEAMARIVHAMSNSALRTEPAA